LGEASEKMSVQHKITLKRKEIAQKKANRKATLLLTIGLLGGLGWGVSIYESKNVITALLGTSTTIIYAARAEEPQSEELKASDPLCGLNDVECESEWTGTAKITTYNPVEAQTDADPFTMASGSRVYDGAIASNCYPLGTKIIVEGQGEFVVEDRMNKRYTQDCGTENERLDIFKWDRADNFSKKLNFKIR